MNYSDLEKVITLHNTLKTLRDIKEELQEHEEDSLLIVLPKGRRYTLDKSVLLSDISKKQNHLIEELYKHGVYGAYEEPLGDNGALDVVRFP